MNTRPTSSWNSVLAKLGLSRKRRNYSRGRSRGHNERRLWLELLESRRLLAVFSVSNLNDTGSGSLRNAINMANNTAGTDEIQFSVNGTIDIASQLPTITDDLAITGPGADLLIIDAGNGTDGNFATGDGFRIFNIDDSNGSNDIDVTLNGLTITGGDVGAVASKGFAIANGGGIFSKENLTIQNSKITGNAVVADFFGAEENYLGIWLYGGGISSRYGDLDVRQSDISGNTLIAELSYSRIGGGISPQLFGGGVFLSSSPTSISDSIISGNSAVVKSFGSGGLDIINGRNGGGLFGGGIYSISADLVISSSTIADNSLLWDSLDDDLPGAVVSGIDSSIRAFGGGILVNSPFQLSDSTISGNSATIDLNVIAGVQEFTTVQGGGIWGSGTIHSSTISGNTGIITLAPEGISPATSDVFGGGLYGSFDIKHSTIANNRVDVVNFVSSSRFSGGGLLAGFLIDIDLDHVIVADNFSGTATPNDVDDVPLSTPGAVDANFRLVETIFVGINGANNILNVDPNLGALLNNGGPTETHALNTGSPAIDAGDPIAVAGTGTIPIFDQRGASFARVVDIDSISNDPGAIDIGAYELQSILNADFDEDGDVDGSDFLAWQRGFGIASGATHMQGDADGDADVDAVDLSVWSGQFGVFPLAATCVENDLSTGSVDVLELENAVGTTVINGIDFHITADRQDGKFQTDRSPTSYPMTLQAQIHAQQPSSSAIDAAMDWGTQSLELLTDQIEKTSIDDGDFDGLVRTGLGAFELGVDEFFGILGA